MILPVGHEESSVRRLPWVTFSLMIVCLAAFLMTDTQVEETDPRPSAELEAAADYWRQHAYLEVEAEVRTTVSYDMPLNQRSQYVELIESMAREKAPHDPDEWAAQQAELDRLTDLALARTPRDAEESDGHPYRRWGLTPASLRPVTLITHIFMHAGWLHLLGNLFMLFVLAPAVEDRLGRPLFGAFFLAAGVAAGLFHAAATPDRLIPLIGASGAIAGVLGAFCVRFWASNIKFYYFFFFGYRIVQGTFEARAWLMLPLWFANELFRAWFMQSLEISDGIAYWAHVGGFLFGAGVMAALAALRVEQKYIHSSIEKKVTVAEANPALEEALDMRARNDSERALALLEEAWQGDRADRDVALTLWDTALACERPQAGVEAMRTVVRLSAGEGETGQAVGHWLELTRVVPTALVDSGTLMRLAVHLIEDRNFELAVRALRHSVDPHNSALSGGLALRAADMAREIDPPTALRAARRALEFPDLHEAKRARMESLVQDLRARGVSEAPDVFQEEAAFEVARAEAGSPIELPDSALELPDGEPGTDSMSVPGLIPSPDRLVTPTPTLPAEPAPVPSQPACPPPPERSEGEESRPAVGALPPVPPMVPPPLPVSTGLREADSAEPGPEAGEELVWGVSEAVEDVPRFAGIKLVEANPTLLEDDGLCVRLSEGRTARIEYAKIDAVAVAVVRGLGPKPVLVMDLLLNWSALGDDATLRALRLLSTGFDPRALMVGVEDSTEAFRAFVGRILEASGAIPLPDAAGARGRPFRAFEDLASYEREVLCVSC